jgi:hypothetical protein
MIIENDLIFIHMVGEQTTLKTTVESPHRKK